MTTATRAVKPIRKLTVARPFDGRDLIVCVVEGRNIDHYFVAPKSSDWGCAFTFAKMGETAPPYDVLLAEDGQDVCGCKGFARYGYCRHHAAARKLVELQAFEVRRPSFPAGSEADGMNDVNR